MADDECGRQKYSAGGYTVGMFVHISTVAEFATLLGAKLVRLF